jgi:hypothetical protein
MLIAYVTVFNYGGCNDGGSSGSSGSSTSPFAGQWIGSCWGDMDADINHPDGDGTVNLVIEANGNISGSIHDTISGADATLSGSIARNGAMNCTFVYSGVTIGTGSTESGPLVINGNNHLLGIIIIHPITDDPCVSFDTNYPESIDLTKQ